MTFIGMISSLQNQAINMQELEDEIWKPIPGYSKYEASTLGGIRSIERELTVYDPGRDHFYNVVRSQHILKPHPNWRGYLRVDLRSTDRKIGRMEMVHRLIALVFIPNPNNYPQVNHINPNKNDNSVNNLEWCTNLHNNRHARSFGLYDDGMKKLHLSHRKLDETQVRTIRKCIQDGMCYQDLATYFGVGRSCIKDIKRKKTWAFLL